MKTTAIRQWCLGLLCFFMGSVALAQEYQDKKLEKLISRQKYEKALKTATRKARKERRNPAYAYYKAWLNLSLAKEQETWRGQGRYLKYALAHTRTGFAYDKQEAVWPDFQVRLQEIHDYTREYARNLYQEGLKKDSRPYFQLLARVFKDTTAEYLALNPPAKPKQVTKNPTAETQLVIRGQLTAYADRFKGTPYIYGGSTPKGFDCSGFTKYVFQKHGIQLPRSSHAQSVVGKKIARDKAKPGDLVIFGHRKKDGKGYRTQHVAMVYANQDGKLAVIHSVNSGVQIDREGEPAWDSYWEPRFLFIRRVLD